MPKKTIAQTHGVTVRYIYNASEKRMSMPSLIHDPCRILQLAICVAFVACSNPQPEPQKTSSPAPVETEHQHDQFTYPSSPTAFPISKNMLRCKMNADCTAVTANCKGCACKGGTATAVSRHALKRIRVLQKKHCKNTRGLTVRSQHPTCRAEPVCVHRRCKLALKKPQFTTSPTWRTPC